MRNQQWHLVDFVLGSVLVALSLLEGRVHSLYWIKNTKLPQNSLDDIGRDKLWQNKYDAIWSKKQGQFLIVTLVWKGLWEHLESSSIDTAGLLDGIIFWFWSRSFRSFIRYPWLNLWIKPPPSSPVSLAGLGPPAALRTPRTAHKICRRDQQHRVLCVWFAQAESPVIALGKEMADFLAFQNHHGIGENISRQAAIISYLLLTCWPR